MSSTSRRIITRMGITTLAALLLCSAAQADDISEADILLCSVSTVMLCVEDGLCFPVSVLDADVPQFIVIDTKKKVITSTKASGDYRESKVANLAREENRIFLQGLENSRAYSILVEEDIGRFSGTAVRDGITLSTFGACTDADVN